MFSCIIISFPLFYNNINYGKIIYINIILITALAYLQYLCNKKNIYISLISFSFLKLNKLEKIKNRKTISFLLAAFSSLIHLNSEEKLIHSKALIHIYSFIANVAFITAITTVNTVSRQTLYQPKLPESIK